MQWYGKALGGVVGFWFGGPIGSMLGVLLGHQFDEGWRANVLRDGVLPNARDGQRLFVRATFEVMGHLAKVDGRVSEQEIQVARRIMHSLRLSPGEVREAIAHFTRGKAPDFPLKQRLDELRVFSRAPGYGRAFVEIQMQAAVDGGTIDPGKRRLLWEIAQRLGVGRVELAQIEEQIRARLRGAGRGAGIDLDSAYRTLGVGRDATDSQIKKAYRRLMNQHHPDKLAPRGLPESMIEAAEQKTHEIRGAYERIKSERGIK